MPTKRTAPAQGEAIAVEEEPAVSEATVPEQPATEPVATTEATPQPQAEKPVKEPRPDGPFTTRNGSPAKVEKGRTFTAGGAKGQAIVDLLKEGKLTRKQIAEQVGCSQSRVAEVAKVLGLQTRYMAPQSGVATNSQTVQPSNGQPQEQQSTTA